MRGENRHKMTMDNVWVCLFWCVYVDLKGFGQLKIVEKCEDDVCVSVCLGHSVCVSLWFKVALKCVCTLH